MPKRGDRNWVHSVKCPSCKKTSVGWIYEGDQSLPARDQDGKPVVVDGRLVMVRHALFTCPVCGSTHAFPG